MIVFRTPARGEQWALIGDDSHNGGGVSTTEVTREEWHRQCLDGVFVPLQLRTSIRQSIIDETALCLRHHACLETGRCGDHPVCEVVETHGYRNLEVRAVPDTPCPYLLVSSHTPFCRCPVHFELYRQCGR